MVFKMKKNNILTLKQLEKLIYNMLLICKNQTVDEHLCIDRARNLTNMLRGIQVEQ